MRCQRIAKIQTPKWSLANYYLLWMFAQPLEGHWSTLFGSQAIGKYPPEYDCWKAVQTCWHTKHRRRDSPLRRKAFVEKIKVSKGSIAPSNIGVWGGLWFMVVQKRRFYVIGCIIYSQGTGSLYRRWSSKAVLHLLTFLRMYEGLGQRFSTEVNFNWWRHSVQWLVKIQTLSGN